ncbi:chorismate mutase [Collybia nuda]|uniref:chorismate mutase n=1 Tax=Collybia nuda TaxID=64659 RepID=A0A9P6CH46_9AGAR|nr:chorismate mutase [Collybia nuda]
MLWFGASLLLLSASPSWASVVVTADVSNNARRPAFPVPDLTQIRDILAHLEAPIISGLTERMGLATSHDLYANNGRRLIDVLTTRENIALKAGRFDYGKMEYPFTLPLISPDFTTPLTPFNPGTFHQDTFSGNPNITKFYLETLVPMFTSATSFYYHLDNSTLNDDAALNLDATLLGLLSHRSHIGKVVAETKYAANVTVFVPLIKSKDAGTIRTLLTNTAQEANVLAQAATAATAFSTAWITSGASFPPATGVNLQNAAAKLFRELIDITTQIEIEYIMQRLR